MTLLAHDNKLTCTAVFNSTIARSHEGMAYFAGAGYRKSKTGRENDRPCAKFKSMTGMKRPPKIPHNTAACKYISDYTAAAGYLP